MTFRKGAEVIGSRTRTPSLMGWFNQPIEQISVLEQRRNALRVQRVRAWLRQNECACGAVVDEKEATAMFGLVSRSALSLLTGIHGDTAGTRRWTGSSGSDAIPNDGEPDRQAFRRPIAVCPAQCGLSSLCLLVFSMLFVAHAAFSDAGGGTAHGGTGRGLGGSRTGASSRGVSGILC